MGCPLQEAIISARSRFKQNPDLVDTAHVSIVCPKCGDKVTADVGRSKPHGRVVIYRTDACQGKDPQPFGQKNGGNEKPWTQPSDETAMASLKKGILNYLFREDTEPDLVIGAYLRRN